MFTYLKIRKVTRELASATGSKQDIDIIDSFLSKLDVQYNISDVELKNIPKKGPFVVIANHAFDFIDSLMLIDIFGKVDNSFKIISNIQKSEMKALSQFFIEPGQRRTSGVVTDKLEEEVAKHLAAGKSAALFLGDFFDMPKGSTTLMELILEAEIPVIPVYFYGSNSRISNIVKLMPPSLRNWAEKKEKNDSNNSVIKLRIGTPIEHRELAEFNSAARAQRYVKAYLYALGSKISVKKLFKMNFKKPTAPETIIDPVPIQDIEAELELLRQNNQLLQQKNNYDIFLGRTELIPNILREIGRLREVTFREVGEGTNQKLDIDNYDLYYDHLFVWDRTERCIIGAYRLGRGKEIIAQHGASGFYITSLFDIDDPLIPVLEKTLELGRSFVVKKYQQKPLPLFLLWQGILCFLRENKEYQYLMGPVSISNDFTVFSKDLMIAFIRKHYFNNELAQHVHPRKEFVVQTDMDDIEIILERRNDLVQLDKFISSIEPNYLKIPVLLKQYIRQNAKIIAFNVDPLFNNCLDGLMILDLNDVPEDTFEMLQSR